jgi:hypothetical protein
MWCRPVRSLLPTFDGERQDLRLDRRPRTLELAAPR